MNSPGDGRPTGTLGPATTLEIGQARISTDDPDFTAKRDALAALSVALERVYVDHGLTGANRDRSGCTPSRR